MILYSIVPPEKVFEQEFARPEVLDIGGGFVEGVRGEQGFTVSRLCTTDLKMYLKDNYSPGKTLKMDNGQLSKWTMDNGQ